uniref:RNA dependent RNA polymerase n=1 Tax=Sarcoptes scabiei TaxID=52283 RepID=A0A1M4PIW9_SARSC|nr:RNA dependent RNA polymerase [Sarcoptes scabiei]
MSARSAKFMYRSGNAGASGDLSVEYGTDLGALTRLEDKIRLLSDDLESEREMRQRIEREKAELQIQVMSLSERLEEAEGSSESVVEMNKKRDSELAKLRKLLEDVHLESEETAHHLRQKHQAAIQEMQDQLDQVQKAKNKSDKEKQKFQAEVFELLAQLETANKEKLTAMKTVEKLEYTVHELNIKIEEINRTVIELTSQKTRLSQENTELIKEVHEHKMQLDNANHLKQQLAQQLEDTKHRLEEEERKRASLENHAHTLEVELESLKVQLDEESEARLELERQLTKANGDAASWKSKYEAELQAHADEVEELRRKMAQKISEYEEQLEALLNKCSSLEKQKSRLQSEVEVLIMDLEKATTHAQQLEKRVAQLEKLNLDLKNKLEEVTMLMEQAQKEARAKAAELQKLQHEYEKLRDQRDALARENKKLTDDLAECKVFRHHDAHRRSTNRRSKSNDWRTREKSYLLPTKKRKPYANKRRLRINDLPSWLKYDTITRNVWHRKRKKSKHLENNIKSRSNSLICDLKLKLNKPRSHDRRNIKLKSLNWNCHWMLPIKPILIYRKQSKNKPYKLRSFKHTMMRRQSNHCTGSSIGSHPKTMPSVTSRAGRAKNRFGTSESCQTTSRTIAGSCRKSTYHHQCSCFSKQIGIGIRCSTKRLRSPQRTQNFTSTETYHAQIYQGLISGGTGTISENGDRKEIFGARSSYPTCPYRRGRSQCFGWRTCHCTGEQNSCDRSGRGTKTTRDGKNAKKRSSTQGIVGAKRGGPQTNPIASRNGRQNERKGQSLTTNARTGGNEPTKSDSCSTLPTIGSCRSSGSSIKSIVHPCQTPF